MGTVPTDVRRPITVVWIAWFAEAMGLSAVLTPSLFRPLEQRISGRRRLGKLFAELHEIRVAYRDRKLVVVLVLAMSTVSHGL